MSEKIEKPEDTVRERRYEINVAASTLRIYVGNQYFELIFGPKQAPPGLRENDRKGRGGRVKYEEDRRFVLMLLALLARLQQCSTSTGTRKLNVQNNIEPVSAEELWRHGGIRLNELKNRPFPNQAKFADALNDIWRRFIDPHHQSCPYMLRFSDEKPSKTPEPTAAEVFPTDNARIRGMLQTVFCRVSRQSTNERTGVPETKWFYSFAPGGVVRIVGESACHETLREVLVSASTATIGDNRRHDPLPMYLASTANDRQLTPPSPYVPVKAVQLSLKSDSRTDLQKPQQEITESEEDAHSTDLHDLISTSSASQFVLLGPPGSGKTSSLLAYLHHALKATDIHKQSPLVPVYIDLTDAGKDPRDLLNEHAPRLRDPDLKRRQEAPTCGPVRWRGSLGCTNEDRTVCPCRVRIGSGRLCGTYCHIMQNLRLGALVGGAVQCMYPPSPAIRLASWWRSGRLHDQEVPLEE